MYASINTMRAQDIHNRRPGNRGSQAGDLPVYTTPRPVQCEGRLPVNQYEDLLVDALLDRGFSVDEALRLIELQNRLERDVREAEERRRFMEWLGRISENRGADG